MVQSERLYNICVCHWFNKEISSEDASGDREDGEEDDDELPCVIGESE